MYKRQAFVIGAAVSLVIALTLVVGCHSGIRRGGTLLAENVSPSSSASDFAHVEQPGGALLWSQNCARCHNLRNPLERSDREWSAIVHQMRVRANLTAEENRLILRFLQAAN